MDEPEFSGYEALIVASPGDQAAARNNLGNVEVEVQVEPEQQQGISACWPCRRAMH
ncbi:hypothetical protein DFR31_2652 [Alkalispirillum mobile]|uniref:Uncharacterized protein n=1 Tax=Alkalispirillum mobile TaxID=85925 RepID=A0A498BSK0_9GAMM|nr:hypothetical protein [Alkalispirillum mobile]RLK46522.1 hypothetical protein DFR31_2652 [Alkalispirillum mobile]